MKQALSIKGAAEEIKTLQSYINSLIVAPHTTSYMLGHGPIALCAVRATFKTKSI